MRFSKIEIDHLLKAWVILSVAFGIVMNGSKLNSGLVSTTILAAVTLGVGFVLHELGHKFMAQRYGCIAEFRANFQMLILAVIMSFFGFIFAAPGAVLIHGRINDRQNGIISLAGPVVNIALAIIFIGISFFSSGLIKSIAQYGIWINSFLALFNMIPYGMFDGIKIWRWNKAVYFVTIIIAFILTFAAFDGLV